MLNPTDPKLNALEQKSYDKAQPWDQNSPKRTNGNLDCSEVVTAFADEYESLRADLHKKFGMPADRNDIIEAFIEKYAGTQPVEVQRTLRDMIKDHTLYGRGKDGEISFRFRNAAVAGDHDGDYRKIATDSADQVKLDKAAAPTHDSDANAVVFPEGLTKI